MGIRTFFLIPSLDLLASKNISHTWFTHQKLRRFLGYVLIPNMAPWADAPFQ